MEKRETPDRGVGDAKKRRKKNGKRQKSKK